MTASAMISPPGASVQGTQRPRIHRVPDYTFSVGNAAIDVAARAGLQLDPWEQLVLIDALGERPDGKWAAFEVGVVAPRQNGKDAILEGRELVGLFVLEEKLIIHSAHEQATASDHFRRLLNLIEGVPEFDQRVMKVVRGKGSEAIELRGGQRVFFKTRTGGGGRGLTGDVVILNEAMILPAATMAALVPTMAARSITANPQLWYAGSAVDREKHEHGVVLARVRERALETAAAAGRLAYFEFSAEGDDPDQVPSEARTDPQVWAQANPGMGIRISAEHIANEADALGAREFAVERLGIGDWPPTTSDADRIISRETWEACAETDRAKRIADTPAFGVDMSPGRTRGAIGIAGLRDDGLPQAAVVDHRPGSDWIVDRCSDLQGEHPESGFVVDKRGPAAALIEKLKNAGVTVVEASAEDYGRACGGFFDEVDQNRLRYPDPQPELSAALAGAKTAPLGDAWKWSRKSSAVDITPLVACSLALWGIGTQGDPDSRVPVCI